MGLAALGRANIDTVRNVVVFQCWYLWMINSHSNLLIALSCKE